MGITSGNSFSASCGRRACAIAKGPACLDKNGVAAAPSTMLDSTMTGRTFSLMRSLLTASGPPNTILCTLLYILLHVRKARDCGVAERSCKYVWKSQKVYEGNYKVRTLDLHLSA